MRLPPGFDPEETLRPSSPAGVADALAAARREGWTVVPVGSGSGTGPLPPDGPFVALSLAGLSGIEEYEPGDLSFTARPGTTLAELDEALASRGQWLPVDPPGAPELRTLGGVVATGLGGGLQAGYGAVRDQVLGMSVVTGDGRFLRLGGKVMKNVAGFDMVRLTVGSRGALAVVVSVVMRVFPRPRGERLLVLDGVGTEALLEAARAVATAATVPASAVLLRRGGGGEGGLLVRLQGPAETLASDRNTLEGAVGAALEAPAATAGVLDEARDLGSGGGLAFRQGGLPADLPLRWRAFRSRFPEADLRADVMTGRIRGAFRETPGPETVAAVREVGEATGGPVLFTALAPELHGAVQPWGGPGGDGGLSESLRARFDPHRVLTPGRFGR